MWAAFRFKVYKCLPERTASHTGRQLLLFICGVLENAERHSQCTVEWLNLNETKRF